jgi:hypothetical protein
MKKIQLMLATAVVALGLSLGGKALAQPQGFGGGPGGGGPGGGGPGGGMDFQNMDPQQMMKQMQQRIIDSYREQMVVTNDDEWSLIVQRITAVTEARTAAMADGGGLGGMMGMGRRGGAGGGPGGGGPGGGGPGGGGFNAIFGQSSPESDALQKAVDDDAPAGQIKTLIAKLQAVHKEKQAKLAQAQENLRAVLTTRQEAIAILNGLLN